GRFEAKVPSFRTLLEIELDYTEQSVRNHGSLVTRYSLFLLLIPILLFDDLFEANLRAEIRRDDFESRKISERIPKMLRIVLFCGELVGRIGESLQARDVIDTHLFDFFVRRLIFLVIKG